MNRNSRSQFIKGHKKIGLSGCPKGNKNRLRKKHSLKTRNKISESKKGKKAWNKGKKMSVNQKEKLRECAMKRLTTQQSEKPTGIEIKLYKELKARHLLFETQKLINKRFLVDAYITKLNLVIEADGDYWHNLDRVKKKDKAENAYLAKCGYDMIRLSEEEINNGNFVNLLNMKGVY